ncbi:hypothetical protein GS894_02930 [Rhodococcus hoagii]|nr:hypothetical protein [Prescottella equi]NKS06741.1 hypothetical protein [Prescottella equi]NKT07371.1 hypothetical protein [Prescottella equi]NKT31656.1 hypothetical protein [Prescottella equi]NKT39421.1 hypothetical protein [Prescottella equi]
METLRAWSRHASSTSEMSIVDRIRQHQSDLIFGSVVIATALAAGALATVVGARLIAAILMLGVVVALFSRTRLWIGLAAAAVPFSGSLGIRGGGAFVAACDLLAMLALASFIMTRQDNAKLPDGESSRLRYFLLRPTKPGLILLGVYIVTAALNVYLANPSASAWITVAQRAELIGVWLLFGACAYAAKAIPLALGAFVATAAVQAAVWITTPGVKGVLGAQKNPSGGFIAAAILIVLLSSVRNWYRLPLLALLTGGLIATGSRGSIIGLVAALAVLIIFVRQWGRVIFPLAAIIVAGFGALRFLPDSVSERLFSQNSAGVYNSRIREVFVDDAMYQFHQAPWSGVGVGNYEQITASLSRVDTHDPHNVFVLALVEGGYPLGVAFALLCVGTLIWLLRRRKTTLVALALVVQISTLAHAYVDVYWVRGTPVVGWMLIGAAAASTYSWQRSRRDGGGASANRQDRPYREASWVRR